MVSCQKGPTRHAYAWQIAPFWQDSLVMYISGIAEWPQSARGNNGPLQIREG